MLARAAGAIAALAAASLAQVLELPHVPRDLSTPVQQRVAFHGPNAMTVAWNTFQRIADPQVHYGSHPSELTRTARSNSSVTYPTSRTWANTVLLDGLLPDTTYYYKIHSTNSTIASFKTARRAGDPTPFTAAVVIDMGVFGPDGLSTRNVSYTGQNITYSLRPAEQTTIERLVAEKDNFDFVIHPGDFAYADAWLKEVLLGYINETIEQGPLIYEGLNEQFWDQLAVVSSVKPYMVAPGNHEANCNNGGFGMNYNETLCVQGQTNFTGFINRFGLTMPNDPATDRESSSLPSCPSTTVPKNGSALPPFWYSFDHGMAHFVMFNTETDFGNGVIAPDERGGSNGDFDGPLGTYLNQQIDFLRHDLAQVDRNKTPWVIAAGHRPWYAANNYPCTVCQGVFEPIFNQHGVDLVVTGHTHNMQRIMPIANNVTDPNGLNNPSAPMYIVNGAGGHFEGLEPLVPLPDYIAYASDSHYGFSKLLFRNRTHLEVQMVRSDNGEVVDTATLYKEH